MPGDGKHDGRGRNMQNLDRLEDGDVRQDDAHQHHCDHHAKDQFGLGETRSLRLPRKKEQ